MQCYVQAQLGRRQELVEGLAEVVWSAKWTENRGRRSRDPVYFAELRELGKWRRRESNLILALSPIQQIRMESHFPAPLLDLTNPPSPTAYHPHTIQITSD